MYTKIVLASWIVKFYIPDLCTLQIKTTTNRVFYIYNIDNSIAASKKPSKILLLQKILENSPLDKYIVLGDFNLHHLNWDGLECHSNFLASN